MTSPQPPDAGLTEVDGRTSDQLTAPAWDRVRDRRAAALLFLAVWLVYLATTTFGVGGQINDTRASAQSAWSLGTRATLALPDEWRGSVDWEAEGRDGRIYTNRFPGPSLWAAPFYTVWHIASPRPMPDHPHLLTYAPAGVATATGAALAVLASFLVFRRLAARRFAVGGAVVLAFGTSVWSVSGDALWPHTLTHLFLMLGLLAASEPRPARAGLAFGATLLSRPHLAIVPAVVGLWGGVATRSVRNVLVVGVTSALGLLAVTVYSRALFGTWLPIAGYNTYAVDGLTGTPVLVFAERVTRSLIDPARGLLIYTPVLLVLLPFVNRGWRVSPWWVRSASIAGIGYLVVQLRANDYAGGAQFFGSRLTLETLVLCSPLLLRTWQAKVGRDAILRRVAWVLITIGVALHALGATVWSSPFVDSETMWRDHIREICSDDGVVGCPEAEPLQR
jgi:hypothetical protein